MSASETFLIAMLVIFSVPYLIWRLGNTDRWAPLVVVQILTGIVLGPGVLGALAPQVYQFIFTPTVVTVLNGIAQWAVMLFVWIAGIELDLHEAWRYRRESGITAGLALGTPLVFGCMAAVGMMLLSSGWIGASGHDWQFVLGVGMSCSVTALPILILFMEKLDLLRQPIGQRILRYASMDDVAIWGVLSVILLDWDRVGRQVGFLVGFAVCAVLVRRLMQMIPERDRWSVGMIWLAGAGFAADWSGMHFMVGAFVSGAVLDSRWFDQKQMDTLRHHVLLVILPVYFLSTGLRTSWTGVGYEVLVAAAGLLAASVVGKLAGVRLAGRILRWEAGEAMLIGWLLQTKALIMIIFANILLDKKIITDGSFTALLLMAVVSTMLTVPMVQPLLERMKTMLQRVV